MKTTSQPVWHTIIIGGGAAGLFCAGCFGAEKLLLEHNTQPGQKLNVTGGGKCNFTNLFVSPRHYVSQSKHFCHNALAAFAPQVFMRLLQQNNIPFEEKEDGKLFAQKATDITRLLIRRAKDRNTHIRTGVEVLKITKENQLFCVYTSAGVFQSNNLVLASGGLSYPALGASGFTAKAANQLGLKLIMQRPALVSLTAPKQWRSLCRSLAGNSLPAEVRLAKHKEEGSLLFTHEGFSGPVILQSSLYWQEGEKVRINLLPSCNVADFLQKHKNETAVFSKILSSFINPRLCRTWLGPLDVKACEAKKETLQKAALHLNDFTFVPAATGGYTRAEVTAGGIDCGLFDPHTMQCKSVEGLFVIGEALDVTGRLGGYNLHWAWASAAAAGKCLQEQ